MVAPTVGAVVSPRLNLKGPNSITEDDVGASMVTRASLGPTFEPSARAGDELIVVTMPPALEKIGTQS